MDGGRFAANLTKTVQVFVLLVRIHFIFPRIVPTFLFKFREKSQSNWGFLEFRATKCIFAKFLPIIDLKSSNFAKVALFRRNIFSSSRERPRFCRIFAPIPCNFLPIWLKKTHFSLKYHENFSNSHKTENARPLLLDMSRQNCGAQCRRQPNCHTVGALALQHPLRLHDSKENLAHTGSGARHRRAGVRDISGIWRQGKCVDRNEFRSVFEADHGKSTRLRSEGQSIR